MKKWWQALFPPADPATDWRNTKVCQETLDTPTATHTCIERGPHYQHVCAEPACKFRWAK